MMKRAAGIVLCLALASAALLLYWRADHADDDARQPPSDLPQANGLDLVDSAFPFSVKEARFASASLEASSESEPELMPEEVIDQPGPECGLHAGDGAASGTAVVVMPPRAGGYGSGARFSTVGSAGVLYSGTLPFFPFQVHLGKTDSGDVITGFGGIPMVMPKTTGLPLLGNGQPLQIYRDGQLIYEKEDIWLFDVANDGSSFFFIEPLGSDWSARLVVVNPTQGTEAHYDLGTIFAQPQRKLPYVAAYTASNEEVHLEPVSDGSSWGLGMHYFFSAKGKWPGRSIHAPGSGRDDYFHLVSSEEGYLFSEGADGSESLHIRKIRLDWSDLRLVAEWHAQGAVGTRARTVRTSADGHKLLFRTATASTAERPALEDDWVLYVLDAATGEPEFVLPTLNAAEQISRLSSILPTQATEEDVGRFNGAFFGDNDQLIVRRLPASDNLINRARRFYDVYDLNSVSLYGQPKFRIEGNQHSFNQCASQGFPGSLYATAEGELAYARRLP